jgi:hypothetical protein
MELAIKIGESSIKERIKKTPLLIAGLLNNNFI